MKMENHLSSTSKTRLPSHFLMGETAKMEKMHHRCVYIEKKLIEMMKMTRFGEVCCLHHCYM